MTAQAVKARGLSKRYAIRNTPSEYHTLSDQIGRILSPKTWFRSVRSRETRRWFWAIQDLDFDIGHGEIVGIVGRNGNGKSTLLKILSKITSPTRGTADLCGRVSSLLEVGTGFHPELSGVDNIYLNGSILGMSRSEIRKKFDEIVSFSEVEDFLHVPVKRYSSGMRVRLAFSVAAHLDPDILIIDEVLAVGDLAFQEKCLQRMSEFASTGRTILFVSHNVPAIQSLCKRVIQLSAGRIVADGPTKQVLPQFVRSMTTNASDAASADVHLIDHPMRKRGHVPILTRIRLLDNQNRPTCVIASGESCTVEVEYRTPQIKSGLAFRLTFSTTQGERIASLHSRVQSKIVTHGEASGTVRCSIPSLILLPDDYRIEVAVGTWDQTLDSIDPALQVTVSPTDLFGTGELLDSSFGPTVLRSDWSSTGQPVIAATHAPSTDSSVPMPVLSSVRDPSKTRAFSSASYSPYDWH